MVVRTKRVYEPAEPSDGRRYLVDRLWPRGVKKAELGLTAWLRDLAPSTELRAWYGHDPKRYATFRRRYVRELTGSRELLDRLAREARAGTVTLLYAARDGTRCNATVLARLLGPGSKRRGRPPRDRL